MDLPTGAHRSDSFPKVQLQAIIADWAGTTVDYGSRAPAMVFVEIFRRKGIEISEAQARGPMGMSKREHIAAVTELPEVAQQWSDQHGSTVTEQDIDAMYAEFLPLQLETLDAHSDVIPGVAETIDACRARGLKIGSSTGYTRELMQVVSKNAAAQGYSPDAVICSDDVTNGRPAPWMMFAVAKKLNVFPMNSIVKVDDTTVGIEAGRNAGSWTVAITQTGNLVGLSLAEWDALSTEEQASKLENAQTKFIESGAHYVIRSTADLIPILDDIQQRLDRGERP